MPGGHQRQQQALRDLCLAIWVSSLSDGRRSVPIQVRDLRNRKLVQTRWVSRRSCKSYNIQVLECSAKPWFHREKGQIHRCNQERGKADRVYNRRGGRFLQKRRLLNWSDGVCSSPAGALPSGQNENSRAGLCWSSVHSQIHHQNIWSKLSCHRRRSLGVGERSLGGADPAPACGKGKCHPLPS